MGTAAKIHDAGVRHSHRVDLPLDVAILNEQFMAIGLWLVEWQIPHEARIAAKPLQKLLQISFTDKRHARAFHLHFGGEQRTPLPVDRPASNLGCRTALSTALPRSNEAAWSPGEL